MRTSGLFIAILLAFLTVHIHARDIYVTSSGGANTGDGTAANPISLARLRITILSGHSGDNEVNVYFMDGTYQIASGSHFTFASGSYTFNFRPFISGSNNVKFTGNGLAIRLALTSPNNTLNIKNITIENFYSTSTANSNGTISLFSVVGNSYLNIDSCKIDNISSSQSPLFFTPEGSANIRFANSEITNITKLSNYVPDYAIQQAHLDGSTVSFLNCILDKWTTNSSSGNYGYSHIFWYGYNNNELTLTGSTISNCKTNNSLFHAAENNTINISGCTLKSNSVVNSSLNFIINTNTSGVYNVYNNTFYSNPITTAINATHANALILNNTIYNSGIVNVNANPTFRNNLVFGTSHISGTNANAQRNISQNTYYGSGLSSGASVGTIGNYVSTTLSGEGPGKQVLEILRKNDDNHPVLKKGLATGYEGYLVYDQSGKRRPHIISIGSVDLPDFEVQNPSLSYTYHEEIAPLEPSYTLDLSDYILSYPEGANADNINYRIITQPTFIGTVAPQNQREVFFSPTIDPATGGPPDDVIGKADYLIYEVSYEDEQGINYSRTIELKIVIHSYKHSLGIIDHTIIKCYRAMEEVAFKVRYKYITGSYNNQKIVGPTYNGKAQEITKFSNSVACKYNGFSIPLVGDLNGDGKPEIVAIGMTGGRLGLAQYADYLCILNGQTGKEIVRYSLAGSDRLWDYWDLTAGGYHSSPSNIALVDSDRDGKAEIILAVGNCIGGNANNYAYRLINFEVNNNTFIDPDGNDVSNTTNTNKLTIKWISNTQFQTTTSIWSAKPIPQIIDIDGNGIPEIVVCHKIYSALSGKELVTLDENYIGRDPNSQYGDLYIPYAYIYDVDMDGKYDIAAGGKLYYDIDLVNNRYKTKIMEGIGDGHTAVADINADGIPDIIVSKNQAGNPNYHLLQVWDPGFFEKDGETIKRVDKQPKLIARQQSYQGLYYDGSHSYIFIGDIDGRVDGSGNKLPEISILGGAWFNSATYKVPVHPNVEKLNNGDPFRTNKTGYFSYARNDGNPQAIGCGSIISFTWDEIETDINKKLKASFVMKHNDSSINTGFTLFDFNNNGIQQICYRDEHNLRIISATEPFFDALYKGDMSTPVQSYTGFEYPVIADIDGDGSADMIVMGQNEARVQAYGYVYAVESVHGDLAPAPGVWNQFMYDPLKIDEDLTTPLVRRHPISQEMAFIKDKEEAYGPQFLYNKTVSQAIVSSLFEDGPNGEEVLRPIVRTPDAVVDGRIDIATNKLVIEIKNTGNASLGGNTPFRIYREEVKGTASDKTGLVKTLNGEAIPELIGIDVFKGETQQISFSLTDDELWDTYIVRISDPSTGEGQNFKDEFIPYAGTYDCNYADNMIEIATFTLRADPVTVLNFETVEVDVFANDVLPEGFDGLLKVDMIDDTISKGDIGNWEIVNNKFRYTAPGDVEKGIIEFTYTITATIRDGNVVKTQTKTGHIYFLVLENEKYGFSTCYGSRFYLNLKERPAGISFKWYEDERLLELLGEGGLELENIQQDYHVFVKPDLSEVPNPQHNILNFPGIYIGVKVLPQNEQLVFKWIGVTDNRWHNPNNWVRVKNNSEYPVEWSPASCVDVIIPTGCRYYPELTGPSACHDIKMENRAMIAGIHYLDYHNAEVELILEPDEKERFVMWSAPLKHMYSGDYHFNSTDDKPVWGGDIFMNFFQSSHPDGNSSTGNSNYKNAFTATFGNVGVELKLGQAFNLLVDNRDANTTFRFPKSYQSYKDKNNTYTLNRSEAGKFIADASDMQGDYIRIPVKDKAEYDLVQVPNPFMAYLKVNEFFDVNPELSGHYKIWNGKADGTFVSVKWDDERGRYIVDDDNGQYSDISETGGYIPPLQSFLVLKRPGTTITQLKISPSMTTTRMNNKEYPSYELRSSTVEKSLLRIRVTQGKHSNATVLHFSENSMPGFDACEDAEKLFNPDSPLQIYSFAPQQGRREPLAINSSNSFENSVRLGLLLQKPGEITLEFTGMDGFEHTALLVDHDDNETTYDLGKQQHLTFTIADYSTGSVIDLPNRFSLIFKYNPTGTEQVPDNDMVVVSKNGYLEISAGGMEIDNLQVYNLWGQRVYQAQKSGTHFKVRVESNEFYIIKGQINYEIKVVKAMAN